MTVLYVAELVGKAGIYALKQGLPLVRKERRVDFVIACGNGATAGNGLGRNHAAYLRKLGAQVITLGDCCFYKKDLVDDMERLSHVLRPYNLNPEAPGIGAKVYRCNAGKVAVAVLLGQSGFSRTHSDNPAAILPPMLERLRRETPTVILDFHAEATAEKETLFALAAGRCSAVIGSHNRVQTADERVINGTAVISDAGRSGSIESVGGCDIESRLGEYLSGIPDWTREAWARPELQGVFVDIAEDGCARSIERIRVPLKVPPQAAERAKSGAEDSDASEEGGGEGGE